MVIAVDFDGTLSLGTWPVIGKPNIPLFEYLIDKQSHGSTIILWTCRANEMLDDAINFCKLHGLVFDYINENVPWAIEKYGGDSRKIFADKYIDDKAEKWPLKNSEKTKKALPPKEIIRRPTIIV